MAHVAICNQITWQKSEKETQTCKKRWPRLFLHRLSCFLTIFRRAMALSLQPKSPSVRGKAAATKDASAWVDRGCSSVAVQDRARGLKHTAQARLQHT
jgi:hypothetical protein